MKIGRPVGVVDLILFLASPASDMINGDSIMLDGGDEFAHDCVHRPGW